jgi:VanZ family protein
LVKKFKLWLLVVFWAGLIFYLSSIPDLKTSLAYDFILRKIGHVFEYFVLTFLLWRAFRASFGLNALGLFMLPAAFALLYAISDELHQKFVPGRVCCVKDVLIDSLGIICFYLVIKFKQLAKQRLK